jgi:hypothetical protein
MYWELQATEKSRVLEQLPPPPEPAATGPPPPMRSIWECATATTAIRRKREMRKEMV